MLAHLFCGLVFNLQILTNMGVGQSQEINAIFKFFSGEYTLLKTIHRYITSTYFVGNNIFNNSCSPIYSNWCQEKYLVTSKTLINLIWI